ncbi:DUF2384 domain-containing protein [Candidatus Pacearchaeota archaeon]|nr:DUF2384 domain-containing protein [Candidatus Pacearchaeota archaeon]
MPKKYTIEEIEELIGGHELERLAYVINLDYIPKWFSTPNEAFDNQTPYEMCQKPEGIAKLRRMVYHIENGWF